MDAIATAVERRTEMKRMMIIVFAIIMILLSGCERNREVDSKDTYVEFYIDPKTKVEYVIYNGGYAGGICPRYNADGSLYLQDGGTDD